LPELAERVYQFMAAEVDIQGTAQNDRFELRALGDGGVEVSVALQTGGDPYFQRQFSPEQTQSLRLYLRQERIRWCARGKSVASSRST
jgi:hypothetical protein